MKTILYSLLFSLMVFPALVFGQTVVNGTVTEKASSQPLPGVNVIIKGTTQGTATDFDGNYQLEVNNGDVLVFTYVGFVAQEVTYTGQARIDVQLAEDAAQLEEVVLIGYGTTTKQDATGNVEKVSTEEFNKGAIVSPEQLLAGKAAGVRIVSGGGAPGEGSEIRIRGGSSLAGNNNPLIVVDGLPLDQRGVQGVRNQLNAINPNEIEDFVVLKDASATAIYGSRASNGVILITTKKGKAGAPLTVEYDLQASVQNVSDFVDVLSASDFRAIAETADGFDPNLLGTANTNWQDQIYQTATGAIHNITVSKGWENFNFRANYNHTSQQGVLTSDLYERNALNLSFVQRLLDNDLKLTLTSKGIFDDNVYADQGAIGAAVAFDPTQPVRNPDGSFFHYLGETLAPVNPVWRLENNNNRSRNKRNITNFNIDYRFWFLKDLKFNLNAGIDYSELNGRQFSLASPTRPNDNNFQQFYTGLNRNTNLDFYFNYKKDVESLNTVVDITAGHAYQEFYVRSDRRATGPTVALVADPTTINRNALESYFARLTFDISDRYLISLRYRRDGSSRFNEDNRWGNFPGVSVGWKISNEDFMEGSFFSSLKLRGGWGVTGQQEIGPNYGYLGIYTPGLDDAAIQFGQGFVNTLRPEEFDENLKWEENSEFNAGLDFGFFNERLTGSVDAYYRETDDLLAQVPIPAGSNLADLLVTNVGSTVSRGLEFGLNGAIIEKDDLKWDVGVNLTFQEVEITNLSLGNDPNYFIPQGGISGGVGNTIQLWRPGLDNSTFFVFRQVYDDDGNPIEGAYVDVNGDNQITEADRQAYKKARPDAYAGLTSNFSWKNLDFNFTFRGSFGNYMYNNVASDRGNISTVTDAPGNYYPNAHVDVLNTNFGEPRLFSDYYVQAADFVRLDNVSLGYLIPGEKVTFRASLTATNLFVITDYEGLDPEIFGGIDNNFYPRPQTYVLGLNVSF